MNKVPHFRQLRGPYRVCSRFVELRGGYSRSTRSRFWNDRVENAVENMDARPFAALIYRWRAKVKRENMWYPLFPYEIR